MAAGFSDGVLRIFSHSFVDSKTTTADWTLQRVLKPHKKAITSIAFSPDGSYLATGSEDNTIFFFRIKYQIFSHKGNPVVNFSPDSVNITPIGFVNFEKGIKTISFSPDNHENMTDFENDETFTNRMIEGGKKSPGRYALVLFKNGSLLSLAVPGDDKYDNSVSFELNKSLLKIEPWTPKIPVDFQTTAVPAIESDNQGQDSTEATKESDANLEELTEGQRISYARKHRGLALTAESPVTSAIYLEGGYSLMSFVNADGEGEIRSFKVGNPEMSKLLLVHRVPFTDVRLTKSNKYLVAGTEDGCIIIRRFQAKEILLKKWVKSHQTYEDLSKVFDDEVSKIIALAEVDIGPNSKLDIRDILRKFDDVPGQYWCGHVFDCIDGLVSSVQTSFDDSYLISSATDGGILIWRIDKEPVKNNQGIYFSEF